MMPFMFSLGQHPALEVVQVQLIPEEFLFAYLDDIYVVILRNEQEPCASCSSMFSVGEARIRIYQGKTKIWNRLET